MMNIDKKPRVIAIDAVSGGGKTTIVKQLKDQLNNSEALYFDDYDFEVCPDDICAWVENGADYSEWVLTPLSNDLQRLLTERKDLDYILLDYPFAYLHPEMRDFIDFAIFIDTPLDIAMARRILRDFTDASFENLKMELSNYLARGRFAYLQNLKTTKPNSDYIVDGSLSVTSIVDILIKEIRGTSAC